MINNLIAYESASYIRDLTVINLIIEVVVTDRFHCILRQCPVAGTSASQQHGVVESAHSDVGLVCMIFT